VQLVERSDEQKFVIIKSSQSFEEGKSVLSLQKLNSIDLKASKLHISNGKSDL
jgi:hypothetical protein